MQQWICFAIECTSLYWIERAMGKLNNMHEEHNVVFPIQKLSLILFGIVDFAFELEYQYNFDYWCASKRIVDRQNIYNKRK